MKILLLFLGPGTEDEGDTDSCSQSINEDDVEGGGRVSSNESSSDLHTEDDEDNWAPVSIFTQELKVLLSIHAQSCHVVKIFLTNFLVSVIKIASERVDPARSELVNLRGILSLNRLCLRVFSWMKRGTHVPCIITEVSQLDIVHEFSFRLLLLFNLFDSFGLAEYECRIVGLSENNWRTQALVMDISTVKLNPISQLFTSQAVIHVFVV